MNKLPWILALAWLVGHTGSAAAQNIDDLSSRQLEQNVSKVIYAAAPIAAPTSPALASPASKSPAPASPVNSSPAVQSIRQLLEQARTQLTIDKLPKLDRAKSELEKSLLHLEQFIGVDTANGKLWSTFLRIPEIKQQLETKTPAYIKLLELEMNMRQNYLGLEYAQFVRLRESLQKFAVAARFYNQEDRFIKFLDESLQATVQTLESASTVDAELMQQLVTIASNLHQSKQAESQLQQLRGMFGAQNVRVTVNESLVSHLGARPVSRPQGVNECILGTRILGTAFMNGNVSLSLMPMNNGVGLQLDLSACLTSQNRGYNRGVVLTSSSSSPVLASKQVFISNSSVSSLPATVSTQLNSTIHSIDHRSGLVRRIARKKAAQQKPQADAIAEGRMQSRIQQQFNEEVNQQAAQAQSRLTEFRQRPIPEIGRLGFQRPQLDLNSTSSVVLAGTTVAEPFQFAATGSCPLPKPATASLVGEIHESALGNGLATIMAGRTIRNDSLGDYVKQITGKIPDDLKDEIEGEEWSITFNTVQPVRIEFEDDLIAITVRLIRMTRGKQSLEESLSISTKYLPQLVDDRLTLTRQGEVVVTSDKQTRGAGPSALRSFLKNKFDKTFRESIVTEPLTFAKLQARLPPESNLRLDIRRVAFRIDQGWLQVAVSL